MFNLMLGEIIFGGVGSGLYGMIIFILLTVFIAGLMVGRTPEYLGKKVEAFEMKMAALVILIPLAITSTDKMLRRLGGAARGSCRVIRTYKSGAAWTF